MQITRLGLESGESLTGKTKEEILDHIYKEILKRRQELNGEILDVVTGEGKGLIFGYHTFTSGLSLTNEATTVTIGETLPGTDYGVVMTRDIATTAGGWNIQNKTTTTFDINFTSLANSTVFNFSWMIVY